MFTPIPEFVTLPYLWPLLKLTFELVCNLESFADNEVLDAMGSPSGSYAMEQHGTHWHADRRLWYGLRSKCTASGLKKLRTASTLRVALCGSAEERHLTSARSIAVAPNGLVVKLAAGDGEDLCISVEHLRASHDRSKKQSLPWTLVTVVDVTDSLTPGHPL